MEEVNLVEGMKDRDIWAPFSFGKFRVDFSRDPLETPSQYQTCERCCGVC